MRKKGELIQAGLCVVLFAVLYIFAQMTVSKTSDWTLPDQKDNKNEQKDYVFFENGYVRSATYFADEWPVNFWNSEMDFLKEDMQQILADGFDSVILVIPWREFQPEISPAVYQEYAFQKLDEVMRTAEACGLGVYARVGYTWDYEQDVSGNVLNRYYGLLTDQSTRDAWIAYVQKMYETLSGYECFREGFLTWEDFWPLLNICDDILCRIGEKKRNELDFRIGYEIITNWMILMTSMGRIIWTIHPFLFLRKRKLL